LPKFFKRFAFENDSFQQIAFAKILGRGLIPLDLLFLRFLI
jgi:hypothetical protein